MNTIHSMSRSAQAYFSENFLDALTAQQKKVAVVALFIFTTVAFIYYFAKTVKALNEAKICLKTDLGDGRFKKVFKDGRVEIGQFKNEKLNGEGQRLFPDELIEDTDDLEGMKLYPKGHSDIRAQEGTFKDGVLSGQGKILFWNGRVYEGKFVDGVLVEGTKDYSALKDSRLEYEKGKFVNDQLDEAGETRFRCVVKAWMDIIDEASKKNNEKNDSSIASEKDENKRKEADAVESNKKECDSNEKYPKMIPPFFDDMVKIEEVDDEKASPEAKEVPRLPGDFILLGPLLETEDKEGPKVEEVKPIEDARSSSEIKVGVQCGADKFEIDIALTDTVLALKTKIYEKYNLETDRQRLVYLGKLLADDQTVESYHLMKDSVMVLFLKPKL